MRDSLYCLCLQKMPTTGERNVTAEMAHDSQWYRKLPRLRVSDKMRWATIYCLLPQRAENGVAPVVLETADGACFRTPSAMYDATLELTLRHLHLAQIPIQDDVCTLSALLENRAMEALKLPARYVPAVDGSVATVAPPPPPVDVILPATREPVAEELAGDLLPAVEPVAEEPASAKEPASTEEPASAEEPASTEEPANTEEPASAEEPASTEEAQNPTSGQSPTPEPGEDVALADVSTLAISPTPELGEEEEAQTPTSGQSPTLEPKKRRKKRKKRRGAR